MDIRHRGCACAEAGAGLRKVEETAAFAAPDRRDSGVYQDGRYFSQTGRWAENAAELQDSILVEDGYDLETHGGGSLENVQGFKLSEPMLEGIGETRLVPLPTGSETMPLAETLHYGTGLRETVCGRDDRAQVDSSTPPWRMICQLIITTKHGYKTRGTGWFISPRSVMTAGHCLFSSSMGGWADFVEVIPGISGKLRPFGSAISYDLQSVGQWVEREDPQLDYGCIILPQTARLGERTGWFGFACLPDRDLNVLLANNSGYPGDKEFGTQWYNAGRITKAQERSLQYMFDTSPGQSGSPTWRYEKISGKRHVVGIHAYGGCANRATRITESVFRNMKDWKVRGA